MQRSRVLCIGVIIFLALAGSVGYFIWMYVSKSMPIDTYPVRADVWLDGKHVGNTPYRIKVFDSSTHVLELQAEGFLPVTYTFGRYSMPPSLTIHLFPAVVRFPPDSQINSNIISEDWNTFLTFGEKGEIVLVNSQSGTKVERYPAAQETFGDFAVSPDGEMLLYHSVNGAREAHSDSFWLSDTVDLSKRTPVFTGFDKDVVYIGLEMGFSPDSKWIWMINNDFIVSPANDPSTPSLIVEGAGAFIKCWSPDGKWLAIAHISTSNRKIYIYYLDNGQWKLFSDDDYEGFPVGWSNDGKLLWTAYWHQNLKSIEYDPVSLINIENKKIMAEFSPITGINSPIESPNGRLFTYWHRDITGENAISIVKKDGTRMITLKGSEYEGVFYWFEDNQRLAILIRLAGENGSKTRWMKIIDLADVIGK